jgi:hypothetical protein
MYRLSAGLLLVETNTLDMLTTTHHENRSRGRPRLAPGGRAPRLLPGWGPYPRSRPGPGWFRAAGPRWPGPVPGAPPGGHVAVSGMACERRSRDQAMTCSTVNAPTALAAVATNAIRPASEPAPCP